MTSLVIFVIWMFEELGHSEGTPDQGKRCGAGDENRTRMTSLEGEIREAMTRPFPYMQRKKQTVINRE
jgi:hypothetical protein